MKLFDRARNRAPRRTRALTVTAVAALGAALFVPIALAAPAAAAPGQCPVGEIPSPGNPTEVFNDDNPAVYVGGDLILNGGAAELEGLVVVGDDFVLDKTPPAAFNVGTVGVGSGVVPTAGEVMLAVGGDLTVAPGNSLLVGAQLPSVPGHVPGGDVQVGGNIDPADPGSAQYDLSGGTLTAGMGPAAIADWSTWGSTISSASAAYAAEPVTGITDFTVPRVTFHGSGAAREVFSISAIDLSLSSEVDFENIAPNATVIINVSGATVNWAPNWFSENNTRVDNADGSVNGFGEVASRTMWNFIGATNVTFGGPSQLLGSILVPSAAANIDVQAHTNGRFYTNGSVTYNGTGNEHHNYPFRDAQFSCDPGPAPSTGSFEIVKDVVNPDGLTFADSFSGTWACILGGTPAGNGTWTVTTAAPFTQSGIPTGATCTVTETTPADPAGGSWTVPDISPATFTIGDGTTVTVTVTNTLVADNPTFGGFDIVKTVDNAGGLTFTDSFTGTWTCTVSGDDIGGTWTATTTTPYAVDGIPVGAECTVSEDAPADPAGGQWEAAGISPATFTVSAATRVEVLVENTLTPTTPAPTPDPTDPDDPGLAVTGGTTPWGAISIGGSLLAAGVIAMAVTALRRRSV